MTGGKQAATRATLNSLLRDPRLGYAFALKWDEIAIAKRGAPDADFDFIDERQTTWLLMRLERLGNLKTISRPLLKEMLLFVAQEREVPL